LLEDSFIEVQFEPLVFFFLRVLAFYRILTFETPGTQLLAIIGDNGRNFALKFAFFTRPILDKLRLFPPTRSIGYS
jgi:hypothetical protein